MKTAMIVMASACLCLGQSAKTQPPVNFLASCEADTDNAAQISLCEKFLDKVKDWPRALNPGKSTTAPKLRARLDTKLKNLATVVLSLGSNDTTYISIHLRNKDTADYRVSAVLVSLSQWLNLNGWKVDIASKGAP